MRVFTSLAREHRLFDRLIGRLESSLQRGEDDARRELRDVFLVLLPALSRHEEIEHLIFDHPAYAAQDGAKRLLALVGAQHRKIAALRGDIKSLLNGSDRCEFGRLKSQVLSLAEELHEHFETEETKLWPRYDSPGSRSLDQRAQQRVRAMEGEMQRYRDEIADYLGGKT